MEISSIYFGLLSIVVIFIYYGLDHKYRSLFLTALSCAFIAGFSYHLLLYVLGYSFINYIIGLILPGSKYKKGLFRAGIIFNILQIILLKYASFTVDPIFILFNSTILVSKLTEIIIPLGVSFFTLQGIGYLVNVKMGWEKPEKNFIDFLLYIIFYLKFLSGPIERSNHFLPQLKEAKKLNEKNVTEGLRIALIGFFKKLVIANQLSPYISNAFSDLNSVTGISLWIIFFITPLYLYFDFSGYTNIAIGFARTLGINLLPNFNTPFFAQNVTLFWKRFHSSLSSWFNDYIFRQVSFKYRRWGIYASSLAVFITWVLFGIWHGAGWNFMILGFLQALVINYEFLTKGWRVRLFAKMPNLNKWLGRILTYWFYCLSLVFFFSRDLKSVFDYFMKLLHSDGGLILDDLSLTPFMLVLYIPTFLLIELLKNDYTNSFNRIGSFWSSTTTSNRYLQWSVYSLMITIIFVVGGKAQQFVYVNF